MPLQRKVFRIEQMSPAAASGALLAAEPDEEFLHRDILAELRLLRQLLEGHGTNGAKAAGVDHVIDRTKLEIAALHVGPLHGGPARASRELDAVAKESERATQKIINAAEAIEDAANTFWACHGGEQEQALAQAILDQVIHIFEACNFQDLTAQRISKATATLDFVEDCIRRMMETWGGIEAFRAYTAAAIAARDQNSMLHGPKLDDDVGCFTQEEVDALFASK